MPGFTPLRVHSHGSLLHGIASPEALIERFYAGTSTPSDRLRILAGRPPVPIAAALASLAGRGRPLTPLWSTA